LDEIPGIGAARKKQLLSVFGSVDEIKKQTKEELAKVVPEKVAEQIIEYFKEKLSKLPKKRIKKTEFSTLAEEIEQLKKQNKPKRKK
jgi:ERCC4-type nuclease